MNISPISPSNESFDDIPFSISLQIPFCKLDIEIASYYVSQIVCVSITAPMMKMIYGILDDHNDASLRQISLENEPLFDGHPTSFCPEISPDIADDDKNDLNQRG